jgi:hypothetical protein
MPSVNISIFDEFSKMSKIPISVMVGLSVFLVAVDPIYTGPPPCVAAKRWQIDPQCSWPTPHKSPMGSLTEPEVTLYFGPLSYFGRESPEMTSYRPQTFVYEPEVTS